MNSYRPTGFKLLPEVVKNLLIINGIMYLATIVLINKVDLIDTLGLHYFEAPKFKIWQFVSYMFLHDPGSPGHISFTHILFNMLALWMFGSAIENVWGPKRFLTYYILTGLGAAVLHYGIVYYQMQPSLSILNDYINAPTFDKLQYLTSTEVFHTFRSEDMIDHFNEFQSKFNSLSATDMNAAMKYSVDYVELLKADLLNAPVVIGASGAIFGLLLAYGMLFPNNIIYIYFAIPMKAKYFVILYGALELVFGFATPGDNVAHFAHIGGLITGFIVIQVWKRNRRNNFRRDYFE